MEDKPTPVRAPDPIIRERIVKEKAASGGGGIPEAEAFIKRGRPFAQATQAIPVNQTYLIARRPAAEEPSTEPKAEPKPRAETKAEQKKKKKLVIVEPPG